jgi:hypothetical protein
MRLLLEAREILWRGNGGGGAVNWISRVDLYNNVSHIYAEHTYYCHGNSEVS